MADPLRPNAWSHIMNRERRAERIFRKKEYTIDELLSQYGSDCDDKAWLNDEPVGKE